MNPVVIQSSRGKYVLLSITAIGFVIGGVFIVSHAKADDVWVGWMNIVFFGACVPIFVWQLIDSRPRLVINHEGIMDRTLGVGVIPWSEITGAHLRSIQGVCFICLDVRDQEKWVQKLSPVKRSLVSANKALGFTALNLNLSAVSEDPALIHELILKTIASYGR
ncbi:MAG: hypothetical protein JO142_20820 [Burkholderiales bacterium]|nr:hypothetical protein [Burkholderiales bacterium]